MPKDVITLEIGHRKSWGTKIGTGYDGLGGHHRYIQKEPQGPFLIIKTRFDVLL